MPSCESIRPPGWLSMQRSGSSSWRESGAVEDGFKSKKHDANDSWSPLGLENRKGHKTQLALSIYKEKYSLSDRSCCQGLRRGPSRGPRWSTSGSTPFDSPGSARDRPSRPGRRRRRPSRNSPSTRGARSYGLHQTREETVQGAVNLKSNQFLELLYLSEDTRRRGA